MIPFLHTAKPSNGFNSVVLVIGAEKKRLESLDTCTLAQASVYVHRKDVFDEINKIKSVGGGHIPRLALTGVGGAG